MFDILAIDWGSKRIGMAFGNWQSDLVLQSDKDLNWTNFWQELEAEIQSRRIKKIIVGSPTNFALGQTETAQKIELFVSNLKEKLAIWQTNQSESGQKFNPENTKTDFGKIEIIVVNERNTTKNSQKMPLFSSVNGKNDFVQKTKIQNNFRTKFKPDKIQLNHLAAVAILQNFLEIDKH